MVIAVQLSHFCVVQLSEGEPGWGCVVQLLQAWCSAKGLGDGECSGIAREQWNCHRDLHRDLEAGEPAVLTTVHACCWSVHDYAGCELCIPVLDMLHLASLQLQLQAHLHDGLFCFQQLQDLRDWTRPCQYTESTDGQSLQQNKAERPELRAALTDNGNDPGSCHDEHANGYNTHQPKLHVSCVGSV